MKPDADAVLSSDLPVPSRPKPVMARVSELIAPDTYTADVMVESLAIVRRAPVIAIDFYKGRP